MNAFRILIGAIFAIAVFAAPWPVGGNWPFTRTCILLFAILILGLALFDFGAKRRLAKVPLIWILLLIGAGYAFFQGTDTSVFLNEQAGGKRPYAEVGKTSETISIYPAASREKLVDLLMGIGLFVGSTVLLRERSSILNVLISLALVGVAVSFFGVVQNLSWNGKLFWQYELLQGGRPFGPFVNKNNGAGFLLITFSAAMYFVTYQLFNWKWQNEPAGLVLADDHWEKESKSRKSISKLITELMAGLEPKHLYSGAAVAVIFAGVLATLSRGGMLALLAGCLVAAVVLVRTNKTLVVAAALILGVLGVGFVVYSEQSTQITDQIETFAEIDGSAPRLLHWQDVWPYAQDHLALGCGIGTYRYAANSFQTFFFQKTYAHAENIYIETLVEMGVGAVVLLLIVLLICLFASIKLMRRTESFDRALGVAGLVCLTSQAIASALDFGLYQPANTLALAVIMGCVVGRSCTDITRRSTTEEKPKSLVRILKIAVVLVLIGCCGWATWESYGIESRKRASRTIKLINEYQQPASRLTSRSSMSRVKKQIEKAIEIRPDDHSAYFQLGEFHVTQYRTEATNILNDQIKAELKAAEEAGLNPVPVEVETIWSATALTMLHRQYRLAQRNNSEVAETIKNEETMATYLPQAWDAFQKAEELCQFNSNTRYRLAELSAFYGGPDEEKEHVKEALMRTHSNTRLMFGCGLIALNSGDQKTAIDLWSKCLSYPNSRPYERPIVEICQVEMPMKSFFEEVLPQNPKSLLNIADKYFSRPQLILPKRLLLVHTKRVISESKLSTIDRIYYSAEAARLSDEFELAEKFYEQALEMDSSQVLWRFEYAKCLHRNSKFDEAIRELKKCQLERSEILSSIPPLLKKIRRDRAKQE